MDPIGFPKKRTLFGLCGILCLSLQFLPLNMLKAQTINDFRQRWLKEREGDTGNFTDEIAFFNATFNSIVQARDTEFEEYLSEEWPVFTIQQGEKFPKSELSAEQPQYVMDREPDAPPVQLAANWSAEVWSLRERYNKVVPRIIRPDRPNSNEQPVTFSFYGHEIGIRYDPLLAAATTEGSKTEQIQRFWQLASKASCNSLISNLFQQGLQLGLDEWGYMSLVKTAASVIYPQHRDLARLLAWHLMLRSGYNVKIGFNNSGFFLLYPTNDQLYAQSYVAIGNQRYYLDEISADYQIKTYINGYPGNEKVIDMQMVRSPNFTAGQTSRIFKFEWGGRNYEFSFRYSEPLVEYYRDRPKCSARIVFTAPVSALLKESIISQLEPVVTKMGQAEASAFLLQFVQDGFGYRRYNDLYGHDKFIYIDEMFATEGINDKGRSLLYGWLVQNLLRLPVAIVTTSGYFSTAVAYSSPIDGDYFLDVNRRYTITDPTWRGVPIGFVTPSLEAQRPTLYRLPNMNQEATLYYKIWEMAQSLGARRSGSSNDMIIDKNGNSYLTGYFVKEQTTKPFLACFDRENSLQWIRKFDITTKGLSYGLSVDITPQNELYLAGSFSGELLFDNQKLTTLNNNPDLFFAQFSLGGDLIWIKKSGFDSIELDEHYAYHVKFDRSGDNFFPMITNDVNARLVSGFTGADPNWLYFTGSRELTALMMSRKSASAQTLLNALSGLKPGTGHTGKTWESILALLAQNRAEITGIQLLGQIRHNNSNWETVNPQLATILSRIATIRNRNGIITVSTTDKKPLNFPYFRFENGARFMVDATTKPITLRAVHGITYNRAALKSELNWLQINSSNGTVLIESGGEKTMTQIKIRQLFLK